MKKYLSYTDIPIYADYDGSMSSSPITDSATDYMRSFRNNNLLMATEASVSFETNLAPNRYLGSKTVSSDYSITGPETAKISLTFIPIIGFTDAGRFLFNTTAFFNLATGNGALFSDSYTQGQHGTVLRMSNFVFGKSFLQNYSIKINPYQPITVSANYISYDLSQVVDKKLGAYTGSATNYTGIILPALSKSSPVYSVMHGLTTKASYSENSGYAPETNLNIEINVDCQRTPIYNLGSKIPESVIVTAIERTTSIQGENIGNVIDLFGKTAAMSVKFAPLSALKSESYQTNPDSFTQYTINVSGVISSQQLSIAQNSMLNGKIVIKEIIL